ncbi:hypothetical protein MXD63_02915 [Frankia sp. Cpl3]|nr:hypothetical protein [Parafrankia colletiae]MCK9899031.1 hypothetical protein [Frankia sp. Cpl3]
MAEHSASKTVTLERFVATRGTTMLRTAAFLAGDLRAAMDAAQRTNRESVESLRVEPTCLTITIS